MTAPQRSKRDRGRERVGIPAKQAEKHTCDLCGDSYYNRGAHAEECRGAPADRALRAVAADHPEVCQARRPVGFNAHTWCVLPFAHSGEHIYFSDAESRRP